MHRRHDATSLAIAREMGQAFSDSIRKAAVQCTSVVTHRTPKASLASTIVCRPDGLRVAGFRGPPPAIRPEGDAAASALASRLGPADRGVGPGSSSRVPRVLRNQVGSEASRSRSASTDGMSHAIYFQTPWGGPGL